MRIPRTGRVQIEYFVVICCGIRRSIRYTANGHPEENPIGAAKEVCFQHLYSVTCYYPSYPCTSSNKSYNTFCYDFPRTRRICSSSTCSAEASIRLHVEYGTLRHCRSGDIGFITFSQQCPAKIHRYRSRCSWRLYKPTSLAMELPHSVEIDS